MNAIKYVILYYPFIYKEDLNVGSGVRPANLKLAFEKKYNTNKTQLIFIHGTQLERINHINLIKGEIDSKDILYCYVEFPNIPLLFSNKNSIPVRPDIDFKWFSYCKKNKIPIGGFVRDIYWKFPDLYPAKNYKDSINYFFSDIYLSWYKKTLDCMFLPSKEMNYYIGMDEDKIYSLPSGGTPKENIDFLNPVLKKEYWNAIYVGGLHETTGYKLMLDAFEKLNNEGIKYKLSMIVREKDYLQHLDEIQIFEKSGWLTVKHVATNKEPEHLMNADFAIIPYPPSQYHDFAMPVKLIEYISFGLPILVAQNTSMNKFIQNINAGVVFADDTYGFIDGINRIILGIKDLKYDKRKIYKKFIEGHTWAQRVDEIEKTLLSKDER